MFTNITSSSGVQTIGIENDDEDKKLSNTLDKAFEEYNAKQSRSEIRTVAHILSDIEPETVIEIGTAEGGSLIVWSDYLSSVDYIVSVDKDHTEQSMQICESMAPDTEIQCIDSLSQNPIAIDKTRNFVQPNGVDFLFIDGGSLEDKVRADYENFSEMVNPGGVIAFHDILTHRARPETVDVHKVWKEVRDDASEYVEIVETVDATEYGFGLMYM